MSNSSFFRTKPVVFLGRSVRILLQKANGPCPLLSLANCLLLRGDLDLGSATIVEHSYLISLLSDRLAVCDVQHLKVVEECRRSIPKLLLGMDVNLSFGSCEGFEKSVGLSLYEMLGVPLLHGWLVDPSDHDLYDTISRMTYDDVTSVATQAPPKQIGMEFELDSLSPSQRDGYLCRLWLEESDQLQMTEHGLSMLYTVLKNDDVAAFYRGHHFFTLTKHCDSLYFLVNDDIYADVPDVVWESMIEVDHRGVYTDSFFNPLSSSAKQRVKRAHMVEQQRQLLEQYSRSTVRSASSVSVSISSNAELHNEDTFYSSSQMDHEMVVTPGGPNDDDDNSVSFSRAHSEENPTSGSSSSSGTVNKSSKRDAPAQNGAESGSIQPLEIDDGPVVLDLPSLDEDDRRRERHLHQQVDVSNGTRVSLLGRKPSLHRPSTWDASVHAARRLQAQLAQEKVEENAAPSRAFQRHTINFHENERRTPSAFVWDKTVIILLCLVVLFVGLVIYAIVSVTES